MTQRQQLFSKFLQEKLSTQTMRIAITMIQDQMLPDWIVKMLPNILKKTPKKGNKTNSAQSLYRKFSRPILPDGVFRITPKMLLSQSLLNKILPEQIYQLLPKKFQNLFIQMNWRNIRLSKGNVFSVTKSCLQGIYFWFNTSVIYSQIPKFF